MANRAEVASRREMIYTILTDGKSYTLPEILQKVTKKYNIKPDGLNKDIKIVKKRIESENQAKREVADSITLKTYGEALTDSLASDLELELILSQIAKGNAKVTEWVKGEVVLRGIDPFEQIAAIDKLYKKRGSYPAIKQEIKHEGLNTDLEALKTATTEDLLKIANGG